MADLRLHPTINREYANRALDDVRGKYKGIANSLGKTPVEVRLGNVRGPGFSETYTLGSTDADKPDRLRVEMRESRRNFLPREPSKYQTGGGREISRDMLAGELLHQLGDAPNGVPFDPKFYEMKKALMNSLTEDQMAEMSHWYQRIKEEGATGTNWESLESALMTSMGDGFIRDSLFPETGKYEDDRMWLRSKDRLTPEQAGIVNKIRDYILGNANE